MHSVELPRDGGGYNVFALLGNGDDTAAGSIAEAAYDKPLGS